MYYEVETGYTDVFIVS